LLLNETGPARPRLHSSHFYLGLLSGPVSPEGMTRTLETCLGFLLSSFQRASSLLSVSGRPAKVRASCSVCAGLSTVFFRPSSCPDRLAEASCLPRGPLGRRDGLYSARDAAQRFSRHAWSISAVRVSNLR
jgi:hypothetical protein